MSKKTSVAAVAAIVGTYINVSPELVKVRENFNPRVKPFTDDLKPSIIEHGVRDAVEAIDNGDGTFTLNAQGHRRLLALQELRNEKILASKDGVLLTMPLKIVPAKDQADLLIDIITLNTGKPLEMIEEARVYRAMIGEVTEPKAVRKLVEKIAPLTGRSVNGILNFLLLTECGPVITKLLEGGNVSGSLVIDLFLSGPCKGDWSKVETAVVEAVATAAAVGKTKATKSTVAADKKGGTTPAVPENETPEQAAARIAKEADAADKTAGISRTKELIATETRAAKFSDFAVVLSAPEGATGFDLTLPEVYKETAGYLFPSAAADLKLEGPGSLTDVNQGYKRLLRSHLADVKEAVDATKLAHKTELATLATTHKAELAKMKIDLDAAQATIKQLTPPPVKK